MLDLPFMERLTSTNIHRPTNVSFNVGYFIPGNCKLHSDTCNKVAAEGNMFTYDRRPQSKYNTYNIITSIMT